MIFLTFATSTTSLSGQQTRKVSWPDLFLPSHFTVWFFPLKTKWIKYFSYITYTYHIYPPQIFHSFSYYLYLPYLSSQNIAYHLCFLTCIIRVTVNIEFNYNSYLCFAAFACLRNSRNKEKHLWIFFKVNLCKDHISVPWVSQGAGG